MEDEVEDDTGRDVKAMSLARLDQMKKEQQSNLRQVKQDLEKEQKTILERQHKLNECNRICFEKRTQLNQLREQQDAKLSSSDRKLIQRLSDRMADTFFQPRPTSDEDTIIVDVHYLPSMEVSAQGRVSGEGGGSRDAKFPVKVTDYVSSLAKSAATYWGLDPDKVFFMDREGRIVFEETSLSEVVLPPAQHFQPASSSSQKKRLSHDFGGAELQDPGDGTLALEGDEHRQWTVRGRNYSLTLVRAMRPGELPTREQLNQPKGEQWQDFTFDETRLAQDLKETIHKYGDPEYAVNKIDMDGIPSLFDLIQAGKDNKKMKIADTRCRLAELMVFLVCFVLVYGIIFAPDVRRPYFFRQVLSHFEQRLLQFNGDESDYLQIDDFRNISTHRQYYTWIHGPLRRTVVNSSLKGNNLFVIGVIGWRYDGVDPTVTPVVGWCLESPVEGNEDPNMTFNVTDEELNATEENASQPVSGSTNTWTSTTTTITSTTTTPAPLLPEGCAPVELKSCPNQRVVEIYARGLREGNSVPPCRQRYSDTLIYSLIASYSGVDEFSFVRGEVGHYFGGLRTIVLLENESDFNDTVKPMEIERMQVDYPAWSWVVMAYSPTLQGVIVTTLIFEKTMSGTVLPTVREGTIDTRANSDVIVVLWTLAFILAACIFASEMRRILRCPKKCTFEHERDTCSGWTCVFFLLPLSMLVALTLLIWRSARNASREALELGSDTNVLSDESIRYLFDLSLLDQYIWITHYITLVILNALLFRYSLMYFPQLAYTSAMVAKVFMPLLVTLLYVMTALLVLAFFFYMIYSNEATRFRSVLSSMLVCITFLQRGGLGGWYKLFASSNALFLIIVLGAFVVLHFVLSHLPMVVLLSHFKEKELRENASNNRFWLMELNKKSASKQENKRRVKSLFASAQEFNPATRKMHVHGS